ncbi:MAG: glycosyltransferase family 4 protein [Candidatus Omnitrophota bacterium]
MNICLVSQEYPPETAFGGIGTYTYHLAQGLAEAGHKVHVICEGVALRGEYQDGRVSVHRIFHTHLSASRILFNEFGLGLEYSWAVFQAIKKVVNDYDIEIVEGPNAFAECLIYSFFRRTPLVTRIHTPSSKHMQITQRKINLDLNLRFCLESVMIMQSNLVTSSSHANARMIMPEVGIPPEKTTIIPLGINLPKVNSAITVKRNGPFSVLFVGRLERRKGFHVLMKAIPTILREMPEVNFIIVGRDTSDGPDRQSFKKYVLQDFPEQYNENVQFPGYVSEEELSVYYKNCDLFIAPSLYESFGLIYVEAMAYGKPVIGCRVGGVPEVVKDGETGILVPPEDPAELARAITEILINYPLREKMSQAARTHVEENFSRQKMVENTLAAYRGLLGK